MQIGVVKSVGSTEAFYYAWGRDPSDPSCGGYMHHSPQIQPLGTFDAQAHTFKIELDDAYYFDFDIDGVQRWTINQSAICWDVHDAYWFGETWDEHSPVGGSASNHQTISVARWQNNGSTSWNAPSWGVGVDCNIPGGPHDYCVKSDSDAIDLSSVF